MGIIEKSLISAEMASLMLRIENMLEDQSNQLDSQDVMGVVTAISATSDDEGTLTVKKADQSSQTIEVTSEAIIFIEKKQADLCQLAVGNSINILCNKHGLVVFIRSYQPN